MSDTPDLVSSCTICNGQRNNRSVEPQSAFLTRSMLVCNPTYETKRPMLRQTFFGHSCPSLRSSQLDLLLLHRRSKTTLESVCADCSCTGSCSTWQLVLLARQKEL